jgi:hypothetical protein
MLAFSLPPIVSITFTLGPEALQPYPSPHPYQYPDSAIAALSQNGSRLMFWSDGATYRVVGTDFFPANAPSPLTPVLGSGPKGSYDANGNWFLSIFSLGGPRLVGFTHVENHGFDCPGPYAEWNAGAVVSSSDGGVTWSREGLAVYDPQPCAPRFGGLGFSSVIQAGGTFLAFGGCTGFISSHPEGAPGSWWRFRGGWFSSPGVNGSSDCLPGVPPDVCCPMVHFNAFLSEYVMVYTKWGTNSTLYIATSADGVHWGPPTVLLEATAGRAIAYGQILGDTNSSVAGQRAVLAYAAAPPVGGQPRDFVYRTITFSGSARAVSGAPPPSTVPAAPPDWSWVRGVNYVPSTSHNDVATFQDYDPALVEVELAFAAQSGFNAVRTFLSSLPWLYNASAFENNLGHFVRALERNNLTSQLVVFDSCFGNVNANLTWITSGLYQNFSWIPNPGPQRIADETAWPALEAYVAAVVRVVGNSPAVFLWDVHNEPDFTLPHIDAFISHFAGVLARLDSSRPITAGIASSSQQGRVQGVVSALSFHDYDGGAGGANLRAAVTQQQALAASLGKGVLLTECMSRPSDLLSAVLPAVSGCLTSGSPKEPGIGFFVWELMLGVDQFNSDWALPYQGLVNPSAAAAPPWGRVPGSWWSADERTLFAAFAAAPPGRCPAPSNASTFIPDTDPRVSYAPGGAWTAWRGAGPVDGTLHYTNAVATAEAALPGCTDVALVVKRGPDCGIMDVYLDGALVAPAFDSYLAEVDWGFTLPLGFGLSATQPHTVLVVATGKRNPASGNSYAQVVGLAVRGVLRE